jgi:SARP family transcriptional regulator, regulator of embCAB operon
MRYEILGPLQVAYNGKAGSISAPKTEQLLATLLIRHDQVVTIEQLIEELWGGQVPKRALAGLYVYVSQLRKFLSTAGQGNNPISTYSSGYILRLGADELDIVDFQELVNSGREHVKAQDYERAIVALESALALWRGPILAIPDNGSIGYGFVTWISELRLECTELLIESRLCLGHHRELVGRLYSLTVEHPLREVFYCQLMLALYRSDRKADALTIYQRARQTLQSELGLEPCRALQDLQGAILSADDHLHATRVPAPGGFKHLSVKPSGRPLGAAAG